MCQILRLREKLQNARHLAPGKVRPALSLVGYPDEVAEGIAFVFNNTLICDDAASAQAVTFARNVGVRSVTLGGDVYEPSGTMSGGAAPSGSQMRGGRLRRLSTRKLRDGRRGRPGEPTRAKLRLSGMSCDCCRSSLELAMPPGYVIPHLIVLWTFPR